MLMHIRLRLGIQLTVVISVQKLLKFAFTHNGHLRDLLR
jgi:hypothetical protein